MPDPSSLPVVTTRRADARDARAVTRLLRGIYSEQEFFVGDGPASERNLARRLETHDPQRSLYLLAVSAERSERLRSPDILDPAVRNEERLAGWLELHRAPAWRLEHVAVLTLAVAPEFRRLGVGRELLESSFSWCEHVGVLKMSLQVRAGNSAAIALYEREGFELEGRERGQIRLRFGGDAAGHDPAAFEDNLIMGKWL